MMRGMDDMLGVAGSRSNGMKCPRPPPFPTKTRDKSLASVTFSKNGYTRKSHWTISDSTQVAMDDDPVVREIPVHLADELRNSLYVHRSSLCCALAPMDF